MLILLIWKSKNHKENQDMFSQDLDHCLEEIKKIKDDVLDQKLKKEQYNEEIESLVKKIEEIMSGKESLKSVLTDIESQKSDFGLKINTDRAKRVAMEEEIDKIKKDKHANELNEQELIFNEKAIKDRLTQSYKIDFDEIAKQNQDESDRAAKRLEQS
jgi:chromosome segregation ATPase